MEWYFALRPRLLVTIPFLLIIGVGFIYHFPLGFFYLVDASARKSGIVKPIRIVDKGDRDFLRYLFPSPFPLALSFFCRSSTDVLAHHHRPSTYYAPGILPNFLRILHDFGI